MLRFLEGSLKIALGILWTLIFLLLAAAVIVGLFTIGRSMAHVRISQETTYDQVGWCAKRDKG